MEVLKSDDKSYDCINISENDSLDTDIESDIDDDTIDKKENILTSLTVKEIYYFKMIDKFFKCCDMITINKMLDIINGQSQISLRILDWFVTRYSNKFKISFDTVNETDFNVHISYKAQLRSYKKRYFDPFRRRRKIYYHYDKTNDEKVLLTTIGQLNFFRWAISNKIVEYVEANFETIIKAMNKSNKEDKIKKKDSTSSQATIKKNKEIVANNLKVVASKKVEDDKMKIILSFD